MESVGNIPTDKRYSKSTFSKTLLGDLEILFFILSFLFLGYKLFTFQHYDSLVTHWRLMSISQIWWLSGVLILLPVNWSLEALKWRILASSVQKLSFSDAVKAVLSGISTGFFTPNRIGELVGRINFLDAANRKSGITLSVVNSLTQNIIMAFCGIPSCILFFLITKGKFQPDTIHFILILMICILIFGVLYFTLPQWSRRLKGSSFSKKVTSFTDCLAAYKLKDLIQILGVSFIRYAVFCVQFYFMLCFFGVELTPWQALISIPTTYLLVTFTPSFAFSEAVVRSSYAILIIGTFSGQVVNIALAGICIWAVNFIIPMLAGSVVIARKTHENHSIA